MDRGQSSNAPLPVCVRLYIHKNPQHTLTTNPHTNAKQPVQTRVLHPIAPAEAAWRRPDAAALAAEGLEAKFAVINLKTKQYKVTKVRWIVGGFGMGLWWRACVCVCLCI